MKKLFTLIFSAFLLLGCEELIEKELPKITLDTNQSKSVTVSAEGQTYDVSFTSTLAWTAEVVYSDGSGGWIDLNTSSGDGGDAAAKITVTVQKNEGEEQRTARLVIKSESVSVEIAYTQEAMNSNPGTGQDDVVFFLSGDSAVVSANGATVQVYVMHNVEYECTVSVDWIHEVESKAHEETLHTFEVDANTSTESRTAIISFYGNGTCIEFEIIQEGAESEPGSDPDPDEVVFFLSGDSAVVSANGATVQVYVMHNVEYECTVSVDWIHEVDTKAYEEKLHTFEVDANTSTESRTATISFSSNDKCLQFEIIQEGAEAAPDPEVDPESIPDDEIWYTTIDGVLIGDYSIYGEIVGGTPFDRNIIEHKYENGLGVIKFDGPVTAINDYALASVNFPGLQLRSVYLPDSVRKIGTMAFTLQENIEVFRVPESLEEINESFRGAKIGSFIGHHLFEDGKGIVIDGVLYTLNYDEEAEELVIPGDVVEIAPLLTGGFSDFSNRPNIKSLYISEGVTAIGNSAFQGCSRLETIHIPNSIDIDSFGTYVFRGCSNIRSFSGSSKWVSPDGKLLYDYMYKDGVPGPCVSVAAKVDLPIDYVIPEGILGIRPCAFENCLELRSITLPDSILLIESGGEIFRNCPNFEFIYGAYASDDNKCAIVHNEFWCDGNALLAFAGKNITSYTTYDVKWLGDQVFSGQSTLEEIIINDEVTNIGNYCFSYCPNLRSITLPASLKVVGYDPFIGSNNLNTIYFRSLNPPLIEVGGIQQDQYDDLTIYVPEQTLDLYLKEASWAPLSKYMKGYHYDDIDYVSSDYSADGTVKILQTATVGNGINVVLMGDAYSDREIADGSYEADMKYLYDNFFTQEPFKTHKDMFNVSYVNVVSVTEGYDYSGSALAGYFGEGTHVGGNDRKCFEYALKAVAEEEMNETLIVVAMNSDAYAGTCYLYNPEFVIGTYGSGPAIAYFPKGGDQATFAQILHHEANGHGFAKLADEYAYEDYGAVPEANVTQTRNQQNDWGWMKNVDFTSDPAQVRWSSFLEDERYANEGLGVFEGGLTYWTGVWRPTEDSIMRYNTGGFNAPSREAIWYRIHKLAYGDSWEYDYEEFVEYDAVNRSASSSAPQKTRRNYVERPLEPTAAPVVVGKSWRNANDDKN